MKRTIHFSLLLLGFSFFSCEKFTDGIVVDIDVPEHQSVLVPYCFINAEDTVINVYVQQSQGILDSSNHRYLENAEIELYKNGALWKEVNQPVNDEETGVIYYQIVLDQPIASESYGDLYELKVSAPNFETVSASQTMPYPKLISEVQHLRRSANSFGNLIDNTRVTFEDTANEENYYKIVLDVLENGVLSNGDTVYEARSLGGQTISNTENMSNALDGVVITDRLFDGQVFTADVGSSPQASSFNMTDEPITYSGTIKIKFLSITRDEYLYQKSLYSYSRAQNNPFAEASLLYSNVSGGLGMFSMMATTESVVEF